MAGKGSKRRPTNEREYRNNWDTIFTKKKKKFRFNEAGIGNNWDTHQAPKVD